MLFQKRFDLIKKREVKIFIVSSCGGHLVQALEFYDCYKDYEHMFIVNDRTDLDKRMLDKTVFITHAERNIKQFANIIEAFILLFKYKPKVIFSLGAAPAFVFSLIGKYFFKTKIIFIDSFSRVNTPSMTAKLIYRITDSFYIQWPSLKKYFPKAKYFGGLL